MASIHPLNMELWLKPTPDGLVLATRAEGVTYFDVEIEIDATSIEDWRINEIAMTREVRPIGSAKWKTERHPLSGELLKRSREFLYRNHSNDLSEYVEENYASIDADIKDNYRIDQLKHGCR